MPNKLSSTEKGIVSEMNRQKRCILSTSPCCKQDYLSLTPGALQRLILLSVAVQVLVIPMLPLKCIVPNVAALCERIVFSWAQGPVCVENIHNLQLKVIIPSVFNPPSSGLAHPCPSRAQLRKEPL